MANPIYYYETIVDATLTIDTMTSDSDYPLVNLNDISKNKKWKEGTGNTSGYIQIDLGADRACNSLVLGEHNYTDTSKGIKLSYCNTNNGSFSDEQWKVAGAGDYHDYTSSDADIWVETFSSITKRYWRLYLEAMGAATYQEIALIYLGTRLSHTVNRNWGMKYDWLSNIEYSETIGGQGFSNKNGDNRKIYEIFWEDIEETQKGNIMDWHENCYNNHIPFYLDIDGDGTELLVRKQGSRGGVRDKDYQIYDSDRLVLIEEI